MLQHTSRLCRMPEYSNLCVSRKYALLKNYLHKLPMVTYGTYGNCYSSTAIFNLTSNISNFFIILILVYWEIDWKRVDISFTLQFRRYLRTLIIIKNRFFFYWMSHLHSLHSSETYQNIFSLIQHFQNYPDRNTCSIC